MSYISRDTKLDYSGDDTVVIDYEWTPDTAAFAVDDVISSLIELPNAVIAPGGTGRVVTVSLLQKAGSGSPQLTDVNVVLFKKSFTPAAINAAMTYAGMLGDIAEVINLNMTWFPITSATATIQNFTLDRPFQAAADETSLWAIVICREAVTYAASSKLLLRVAIKRD